MLSLSRLASLKHGAVRAALRLLSAAAAAPPLPILTKELRAALDAWTPHAELRSWLAEEIEHCAPARVHLMNGTEEENDALLEKLVQTGTLQRLNERVRPNSFLARSPPADVARVESRTFICSISPDDAGPLNNHAVPQMMRARLSGLFAGTMAGRTMYVLPFSMGPLGSPLSAIGVQVTDSAYAAVNMRIMTRGVGTRALEVLGTSGSFVKCLHSVGVPLQSGKDDVPWPQNDEKYIAHFPEARDIVSYGSGYGGNALLGKKCYALRIASVMGRDEGWFAEHMTVLGVTSPSGKKTYVAAAFPSACGKTNFAMLIPSLPGWKVETVGDDIAWMRFDAKGRLRAINPEAGFFGVAPGTSAKTNANALAACHANTIFTNVALTRDNDVWWEGLSKPPPASAISWLRREWSPTDGSGPAAHPNSRFTAPASQCPSLDPEWDSPAGVVIEAIIFGGRRSDTTPLVYETLDWEAGVFAGATLMSETTHAAAEGKQGELRADPMAMRPFIGYHAGDYFDHWLKAREHQANAMRDAAATSAVPGVKAVTPTPAPLPRIYAVNWFSKDKEGGYLWPGFGHNIRVLEWICARVAGSNPPSIETPIGYVPDYEQGGLNTAGSDVTPAALKQLFNIDAAAWRNELSRSATFLDTIGPKVPQELRNQGDRLRKRLDASGATKSKAPRK